MTSAGIFPAFGRDAQQSKTTRQSPQELFPAFNLMSEATFTMSREELQALYDQFREIKHGINNTLAVVMALSELAQRNPAHYEKLAKAVLQRGPEVVQHLQEFQTRLSSKLKESDPSAGAASAAA
jgi:hypothetical protein